MAASRGYLGPLGDDFPAIFPIALGLLFFFGAISLTYDYYNQNHETALLMEANSALGKAARSQLIFDEDHWEDVCEIVDKTKANYGVRARMEIVVYDDGVFENVIYIPQTGPGKKKLDENPCVDYLDDSGNDLPYITDFFLKLNYPILIEAQKGFEIATLQVTTWK